MQAAQWAPLSSGKNLLGKILDGIREELWDDSNYKLALESENYYYIKLLFQR